MRACLVAPFLLSGLLWAVPSSAQQISGGGKVGLVVGDLRSDDPLRDSRPKGGFAVGGFVDIPVAGAFSVEPQLFLVQKGAKVTDAGQEVTFKLHYLEVPVLGLIRLPRWGEVRPFVYGGPAVGFNLSARAARIGRPDDVDIADVIRGTDVAITYGGGLTVDRLTLEARYTQGLSNIATVGRDLRTRAFILVAGFSFPN